MFLIVGIILLVLWLLGFIVFQVAGWFIHLLLVIAVVMIILRFIRGK